MTEDVRDQAARLAASFRAKGKKVNSNLGKAITKACLIVEREAKLMMTNTNISTEVVYHRGMVLHWPSMPWSPPAVDTGLLRASITHRVEGGGYDLKVIGYVGTNVKYAPYLEFGTSRMIERPFLTPALEKHRTEIKDMIATATRNGLRGLDEGVTQ